MKTPAQQKRLRKKVHKMKAAPANATPKQVKKDGQHPNVQDRHLQGVQTQYIEHGSKFDRSMSELDAGL